MITKFSNYWMMHENLFFFFCFTIIEVRLCGIRNEIEAQLATHSRQIIFKLSCKFKTKAAPFLICLNVKMILISPKDLNVLFHMPYPWKVKWLASIKRTNICQQIQCFIQIHTKIFSWSEDIRRRESLIIPKNIFQIFTFISSICEQNIWSNTWDKH
jgi:hypothetical protein